MKLPIGIEFFRDIRTRGYYYVDKTGFIRDLLDSCGSVNLFTRPRRFGKSLNMDMLKTFFEIGTDPSLFEGLEISKEAAICQQYMGKYPVISISLKDVEGMDFQTAYGMLGVVVSEEAGNLEFLMESDKLTQADKKKLNRLIEGDFEKVIYLHNSLKLLTQLLFKHYGSPVIVLIDEYDVPLDKAYQNGYYPEMVSLIRSLFSQALKTNKNLYFAVITGCLRIARESIFTGLNNFKVRTISDIRYAEYFGFTTDEVRKLLCFYDLEEKFDILKEWYDGYHFGHTDVYCPWDVINQCDKFLESEDAAMEAHWENSSSNAIIQDILMDATETTKSEIEALISGEAIEKTLIPELTYTDLDSQDPDIRQTYLWSVLFATGYLTEVGESVNGQHRLAIPNKEVLGIYEKKISSWFRVRVTSNKADWKKFCTAIGTGDAKGVQDIFNEFLAESISIRDTFVKKEMKENLPTGKASTKGSKRRNPSACFYHGMLLGLLKAEKSWIAKSNAESGIGYTDIKIVIPASRTGCIIEVKYAENGTFQAACQKAMEQIENAGYAAALKQEGMKQIHKYGIACYRKSCRVTYCSELLPKDGS